MVELGVNVNLSFCLRPAEFAQFRRVDLFDCHDHTRFWLLDEVDGPDATALDQIDDFKRLAHNNRRFFQQCRAELFLSRAISMNMHNKKDNWTRPEHVSGKWVEVEASAH